MCRRHHGHVHCAGRGAQALLAAVIMTSPGTILMAKMLVPETGVPATEGTVIIPENEEHKDENLVAQSPAERSRRQAALNVAIMLISFLALVALLDSLLGWVHGHYGFHWVPAAWGRFWASYLRRWRGSSRAVHDAGAIGNLLGTRMALNEVVAYIALARSGPRWRRARSPSRRLRCADSPTLARSACRSRHRRAGARAAQRPGAPRRPRHAGRDDGEFDFGIDCGDVSGVRF